MRWFWQKDNITDVEREVQEIEKEERKSQKHYNRVANLAIWTIAFGAILSTSGDIIDKLFNFSLTPAQLGSLIGYFIAVFVGNSMMFAAAKKILYAIEVKKPFGMIERICIAVISIVMIIETVSFLTFLWNFEHLKIDLDHAVKIFITSGRALILSTGAVFLELYFADGVSPARIQSLIRKMIGLGTLKDLYRIMSNENIATHSKVNMYAASLDEYNSPVESIQAIASVAQELVDKNGQKLISIPPPKDPYIIEGSLASAQKSGTIETDDKVVFVSATPKKNADKAHEKPAKKKPIVRTRASRSTEQQIEATRKIAIETLLSTDNTLTNYAISKQLKLTETQVKRIREKYEI
jgi:hypothetical protein